jgi:hypothetical protein
LRHHIGKRAAAVDKELPGRRSGDGLHASTCAAM